MKIFLRIFLVLILIFNSSLVHAISPNPIIKGFKALKGLFSKSADELPDIGKRLEDFKNVKNSDNTINPSIIDEIDNIKHNEARTLSEFENLNSEEILETHNIKNIKRIKNTEQIFEVIDAVDLTQDMLQTAVIMPFLKTEWQGKVFKKSNYFNNPELKNRILIKCSTNLEDFYFTVLFDEKQKNWLLLSGNFTSKNKAFYKPSMSRQELLVLDDLDEYLFFSNKPKQIKQYPTKYFIIFRDSNFEQEISLGGIKTPKETLNSILSRRNSIENNCKRVLLK